MVTCINCMESGFGKDNWTKGIS